MLRQTQTRSWLRIHSLPGGKRIARTSQEETELLRRQNEVGAAILGEGKCIALVLTYANGYRGEAECEAIRSLPTETVEARDQVWRMPDALLEDLEDTVFGVAMLRWHTHALDGLIRKVALGETAPLLFFALDSGWIYSPYDGGADLFVCSEADRNRFQEVFGEYVSPCDDGL